MKAGGMNSAYSSPGGLANWKAIGVKAPPLLRLVDSIPPDLFVPARTQSLMNELVERLAYGGQGKNFPDVFGTKAALKQLRSIVGNQDALEALSAAVGGAGQPKKHKELLDQFTASGRSESLAGALNIRAAMTEAYRQQILDSLSGVSMLDAGLLAESARSMGIEATLPGAAEDEADGSPTGATTVDEEAPSPEVAFTRLLIVGWWSRLSRKERAHLLASAAAVLVTAQPGLEGSVDLEDFGESAGFFLSVAISIYWFAWACMCGSERD